MKKLFLSLAMLAGFLISNAQTGINLFIQSPDLMSYSAPNGNMICLNDNPLNQGIMYTVTKNTNQQFSGTVTLIFTNASTGQTNKITIETISDLLFPTGENTYTNTYALALSNTSNGVNGTAGLINSGKVYIQFSSITLGSPSFVSSQFFQFQRTALSVSPATSFCPTASPAYASLTATGVSGATYSWSPATGLNTSSGYNVHASPNASTIYTVTATTNGCASTKTVSVTKANNLSVVPTAATSCPNQGTTLTASGSTTYSWSPPTGLNTTTGATVIATPTVNTTYTVTSTKNGVCPQTKTVPVTVVSPCGSTLANAIDLGSFYTCPMIFTQIYNNSTSNNYGNDYGTNKPNGQASDDIYFKIYYDSYQGEGTMFEVSTSTGDPTYTDFDTYIHLLDANGNWLQSNDNASTNTLLSRIGRQVFENYYYIVIEGKGIASGNFSLFINAGSDCARIGNIDASNSTGTLSISPNPADDYLTINLPSSDIAGEITIYSMEGTLIKTISTQTQSNTISVNDLTAGFYLFKIKQGDFSKTEKIIIN
ncbi:T9SS type A sorting domain-containing protein [Cytophaga aurantiaca]|uniref:T9SS type A sorting domain-containing protein n=1 Tax=Cytophaga aurantiaca TaxID=29530 RepID=UPI00037172B2|nr:T9SS type A sorting domain-containing protein [Cytophaga aurantiaca]